MSARVAATAHSLAGASGWYSDALVTIPPEHEVRPPVCYYGEGQIDPAGGIDPDACVSR